MKNVSGVWSIQSGRTALILTRPYTNFVSKKMPKTFIVLIIPLPQNMADLAELLPIR